MASRPRRSPIPISGINHGTLTGYVHHGCGCTPCRLVANEASARSQRNRNARTATTAPHRRVDWSIEDILFAIDLASTLTVAERAVALERSFFAVRALRQGVSAGKASIMAKLDGHEGAVNAFRRHCRIQSTVPAVRDQATRQWRQWTVEDILVAIAVDDQRTLTQRALDLKRTISAVRQVRHAVFVGRAHIMPRLVGHEDAVAAFRRER